MEKYYEIEQNTWKLIDIILIFLIDQIQKMLKKKITTKFKLINLFNSNLYLDDAEEIRKNYNLNVKNGLTNTKNIISKADHLNWLQDQKKKKSKIFVAKELNKMFIGYIRSEKFKKYQIISISLKNKYRKQKLGSMILNRYIKKFQFANLSFLAIVKKNNIKSINFFKKNNFKIINISEIKNNKLSKNFYLKFNKD